jgi:dCMP deaminase
MNQCQKLSVKAIIYRGNRVVGAGYNKPLTACDNESCHVDEHCVNTIHAEAAALLQAGTRARGASMRVSHEPCWQCRKLIIAAGISKVYYENDYYHELNHLFEGDVEWVRV